MSGLSVGRGVRSVRRCLYEWWSPSARYQSAHTMPSLLFTIFLVLSVYKSLGDRYHVGLRDAYRRPHPANVKEANPSYWVNEARAAIRSRRRYGVGGPARNVVLFLGDGMSVPTLTAARILLGQRQNRTGEESKLSFDDFPTIGFSKTYCVDAQIADSACTATAYLCGVKANYGTIGLTASVPRNGCSASRDTAHRLESIAAWALADGRDTGIVTTTRVTHASPAGAYARIANRDWENDAKVRQDGHDPAVCPDIAHQLIHTYPGNQFKVILGGGRQMFLPENITDEEGIRGMRTDGRDLIEEWQLDKMSRWVSHRYVWNREQLKDSADDLPEYLLGLFEGSHMRYHLNSDRKADPTLVEMTEIAIQSLRRNKKGFFLFVEGGRIDHGHHENRAQLALDETLELSAAVARASELLSEDDSLVVVTADHSHVMTINGYTHRGSDILGPSDVIGEDGVPYMTLSYANGPGYRPEVDGVRPDVTREHQYGNIDWMSPAGLPLIKETHGGEDVAVFARGPQSGLFSGVYEESQLPHLMAYAACIGSGPKVCDPSTY